MEAQQQHGISGKREPQSELQSEHGELQSELQSGHGEHGKVPSKHGKASSKVQRGTMHKSMSEGNLTELPMMININEHKYIKLMKHRDNVIMNIREYIPSGNGRLYPTKKGILLSIQDWQGLKKGVKNVDKFLKQV
jgi:hypothetical protein